MAAQDLPSRRWIFFAVDFVDDRSVLVSESGIRTYADLMRLAKQEVRIALVGESLMREERPGDALRALLTPRAI